MRTEKVAKVILHVLCTVYILIDLVNDLLSVINTRDMSFCTLGQS